MTGMTRRYRERFARDVKFTSVATLALVVVGWWRDGEALLLIPIVVLLGGTLAAFDGSHLVFARRYLAKLERDIIQELGEETLVAAKMEYTYLFPRNEPGTATAATSPFTWFAFMTLFITGIAISSFGFSLALGLPALSAHGSVWLAWYLTLLGVATLSALLVAWWWFVGSAGEKRLNNILGLANDL